MKPGRTNKIIFILAIVASLIHLYYPLFGIWKTNRVIHLLLFCIMVFLIYPLKSEKRGLRILGGFVDTLLIAGTLAFSIYPLLDFDAFILRAESLNQIDVWMGVIAIIVVLEGVRRATGLPMMILSVAFLVYAYVGPYMPEIIAHKGAHLEDIVNIAYVVPEGLYGLPISVMVTYVFLFIMFGSLLEASGGSHHIMNVATALVGRMTGGPAKIAVISSCMMGTISGSAVANVATTGAVTIPLMKRMGFPPHLAGAIEAVASTGGMITPPIMGAAAFIMCELVSMPYLQVIIMAAIPAFFYYFALFIVVHLECKKLGLTSMQMEQQPSVYQSIKSGWWVVVPLALLIGLLVSQYSAPRSVVVSILCLIIIILVKDGFLGGMRKILKALDSSARSTCPLTVLCAAAGIVISMVNLTGLGIRFSSIMLTLSQGIPIIALLITAFVCTFLGMGLPVTAAYLTTVAIAGPALIKFGFPPPASHLFIIFFAVISNITPPFCMAAYTASGIAQSDVWKTGWTAFKYGFTGYFVPFLFIFYPPLLILDTHFSIIARATLSTAVSVSALAIAIVGCLKLRLSTWRRLVLGMAGILIALHPFSMNIVGFCLYGLVLISLRYVRNSILGLFVQKKVVENK